MRIGELLLESELVNAKQLAESLHYARAKALPLGRCFKILRYLTERDLERALETQQLIRKGLDPKIGVEVLRLSAKRGISIDEALREHARSGADVSLKKTEVDPAAPAEPATAKQRVISPFELIAEGDKLFAEDKLADAEKLYSQGRELLVSARGEEDLEVAAATVKLANLYLASDRFDEADKLYRRVLEIYRAVRGPEDVLVAKGLEDLGDLCQARGESEKAAQLFSEAYAVSEKQSPLDIGITGRLLKKLASLSSPESDENKRKRIGEFCTESGLLTQDKVQHALQRSKQTGKPLGTIIRDEQLLEKDQVESLMLAQLLTKEEVLPYSLAIKALALSGRAGIPLKQICEAGRIVSEDSENSAVYRQLVLEQDKLLTAETLLGSNHVEVAVIAERLADLYAQHNDRTSALMLYKRAQQIYERAGKEVTDKPRVAALSERYASVLAAEGRHMEAESLLLHALEMLQVSGEAESLSGARCLYQLALTQTALGNSASALSFMRNAIAMYHAIDIRACPPGLFESLAQAYTEAGQPAEAEKILNMMLAWAHEKFGPFEPETADVIQQLADLHCASGKQEQASAEYYQALQIYQRSAGCEEKFKQLDKKLATAAGGK